MFSKVLSDLLAVGLAIATPFVLAYIGNVLVQRKFTTEVLLRSAPRVALMATAVVVIASVAGVGILGTLLGAYITWKGYTYTSLLDRTQKRHDPQGYAMRAQ